jgi:broad specificity phosphatase PhoE
VLILARHGETTANVAGHLLGRADPPLTDRGRQQAADLAAALPGAAVVVSSPLARARQTAEGFGLPVEVDERWTELDYGVYDDRPPSEMPASLWERWRSDPDFAPEGGESLSGLGGRVRSACEDLAGRAAGADIVVVSHVSPIKAAVAWALGVGDAVAWRMFVGMASISRLDVGPHGPLLVSFNERHHLRP